MCELGLLLFMLIRCIGFVVLKVMRLVVVGMMWFLLFRMFICISVMLLLLVCSCVWLVFRCSVLLFLVVVMVFWVMSWLL